MTTSQSLSLTAVAEQQKLGNLDAAERLCRELIDAEPANVDAQHRLATIIHRRGRCQEAVECFRQVLEQRPADVAATVDLAHALTDAEQFDEAVTLHRRVVELAPDIAAVHYNLGGALHQGDRLEEAADCYRDAIVLDPESADARLNLGIVLRELGRPGEAIEAFDVVLQLRDGDPQAHLQRALTWLQSGDFERGWDEYEWRFRAELEPRAFALPQWDGSSLEGRSLLIHGEQGVGDEIQFASCISEVAGQTSRCLVECDPRLVSLFARSFPLCEVFARASDDSPKFSDGRNCDVQIPMASLPRIVRRSAESFPTFQRYLKPDTQRLAKWRTRYAELGTGFKVGIAWLGGSRPDFRRRRSTALAAWVPILKTPGVHFVNLQHGDHAAEISAMRQRGITIHDWPERDTHQNVDDVAARIAALDLVMTVDNSTAHLTGALGIPVWTMLPAAADWRWLLGRDNTLWYASMTLFRQSRRGDWSDVFDAVAAKLQEATAAAAVKM